MKSRNFARRVTEIGVRIYSSPYVPLPLLQPQMEKPLVSTEPLQHAGGHALKIDSLTQQKTAKIYFALDVMPYSGIQQMELIENLCDVVKFYVQNPDLLSLHCVNHAGDVDAFQNLKIIYQLMEDVKSQVQVLHSVTAQLDARFSTTVETCMRENIELNTDRFLLNMITSIVGKSTAAEEFVKDSRKLFEILMTAHTPECNKKDGKLPLTADIFSEDFPLMLRKFNKIVDKYYDVQPTSMSLQNLTVELDSLARAYGVTEL